jgi:release factor glutamine methyltransferase
MQPRQLDRSRIRALIAKAEQTLAHGPHPERARRDAETILLHIFRRYDPDRNLAWLLAHGNDPCSHGFEMRVHVERRLRGEPIQYITGETEFYGLSFRVTRDVLIPRPETEQLVEKILEWSHRFLGRETAARMVDVGTGSGAIAVALARKLPQSAVRAAVTAIDLSRAALDVARQNAEINGVADRIRFLSGDLLAPVAAEKFEIVVSNPPYVPSRDRDALAVEVRDYEPGLALFAGDDGLDVYRRLIPAAFAVLTPGGLLALECGYGQEEAIGALLAASGFMRIEFFPDLQGIPRVVCAQRL